MVFQKFMQVFMYLLEQLLNSKADELKNVSFSSDEANTDRPLKEYVKTIILENLKTIPAIYDTYFLIIDNEQKIPFDLLRQVEIKNVYLPDELTAEIKRKICKKTGAIYRNPDLLLELLFNNTVKYITVELKSTKDNSIPGSSAQQVDPNEWVVFVKHHNDFIDVATGQYIHAINSVMQFPDRSPRPQVSFNELKKWNNENRSVLDGVLYYKKDISEQAKYDLLNDWQGVLAKRWVELLFNSTTIRSNEPWFNNNIRRFCIEFLNRYESLPGNDKELFKNNIKKLIDEYQKRSS